MRFFRDVPGALKAPVVVCLLSTAVLCGCVVKNYPRNTTVFERVYTDAGWIVDKAGAEILPRYNRGRRYDLQRQTPTVEYSYYMDKNFRREPELFYPKPDGLPRVEVVRVLAETRRYRVDLIKWESLYQPQNREFGVYYKEYVETHTAWAIYARNKRGNRAAMVMTHRWSDPEITKTWRDRGLLDYAAMGYDVVYLQLPYHGFRALEGSVFSGEHFVSGEVSRINEAMCQTVTDIRSMVAWLRLDHLVVGVTGRSMGGTASLMTAVVEPVDFVVAWVPPSSLNDMFEETDLAPFIRMGVRASDLDRDTVNKITWVSSPDNYEPMIPVYKVLVFAGMGDRFAPPDQPEKVMKRWGSINMVWFAGGHLYNFQKGLCRQIETAFLEAQLPP